MVIYNRQRGEVIYHRLSDQRINDIVTGFRETGRFSPPGTGLPNKTPGSMLHAYQPQCVDLKCIDKNPAVTNIFSKKVSPC
jgi:hypothetical protein